MTPEVFLSRVVVPAIPWLDDAGIPCDANAVVLLVAIAGQESGWRVRQQIGGPARSFWQFERAGGVRGVLTHPAAGKQIRRLCDALCVPVDEQIVYEAMAWCDPLAIGMARLLLWTDPRPIPAAGDANGSWAMYQRTWRPGRPHPEAWADNYRNSILAVT